VISGFLDISNEVGPVKSVFISCAHTPTVVQSRYFLRRALRHNSRVLVPVQPTSSVRVTFIVSVLPTKISPITCDHDDFFELPTIEGGG
jgi:hypothetical protein